MYYRIFFCLLFILITFVLISCRYEKCFFDNEQHFKTWQKHKESLLKVKRYQIRGIITYSIFQTHWKRLSFIFQKINDEHYKFIFINPIGLKNIEIDILEHGVCTFDDKNMKNCCSVGCFENVIQKLVHLKIPFKNFKEWIVGLPGYECDFTLNNKGYLEKVCYQCNSDNFTILYKSYYNVDFLILPKIMEISCNNSCYFNIKIYDWKVQ